ncbi:hypothetical protein LIER_04375 [Lithospermum erythrorhizon]|uniref:Uncharacterized protein n=1 Tax=Lithospermum erythrorhizon TaxID=34254 RepID=A0AAV3NXS2_LITER
MLISSEVRCLNVVVSICMAWSYEKYCYDTLTHLSHQMERATLRNDTRNWTARVTITEDISILTSSHGLQLKRYVFTDDEGNQIMATIFADIIPVFSPVLQPYKVYEISGAQVRFVQPEYRILDQSQTNQWVLQQPILICPITQLRPNLRYILDGITPIGLIPNAFKSGITAVGTTTSLKFIQFYHPYMHYIFFADLDSGIGC